MTGGLKKYILNSNSLIYKWIFVEGKGAWCLTVTCPNLQYFSISWPKKKVEGNKIHDK